MKGKFVARELLAARFLLLLTMLCVAIHAQTPTAVEGLVVNSATGRPVAGATVVLQSPEDSYVLETGPKGRFQADDVAPGPYEAHAQRDGFTAPRRSPRFTVEAGRQVQGIELRLIPLGVISGRVVDADGDPVSKASVEAVAYDYAQGKKDLKPFGRGTSDDHGEFRIAGLPPGAYYLRYGTGLPFQGSVMSSMRVLGPKPVYQLATTYFPSAAEPADAVLLDLPAGAELRNNVLTLRPAQAFTIRVTITGNPAAGSMPAISMMTPGGGALMLSAKYGGTREFPNSVQGTYVVEGQDRPLGLSARQVVKLLSADVDVTLALRPEVVITGTVRVEGSPLPLDAVRVRLDAGDLDRAEAAVKPDGTFALRHVQPVTYGIHVTAPGGGYLKSIRVGEWVLTGPQLDAERATGTLAITLGTNGGRLDGTVVDAQGAPLDGAVVVAAPAGRLREWTDVLRSATSDNNGKFELRDLAPGDYQLLAWEDAETGAPLDADFRKDFERQAKAVRIAPQGRETVRLQAIRTGR